MGNNFLRRINKLVISHVLRVEKEVKMTLSLLIGNELERTSAQMIF